MNIIKEILTLPKTNGGKKRRYNLLNQLNIEKKDKNEIAKTIDSSSGSSGSKDYDDLHTFLYYDDRIVTIGDMEIPACALVGSIIRQLREGFLFEYGFLNSIVKMNNTKDIFGINWGNYIILEMLMMNGSGLDQEALLLINGISIPKYILPEYIGVGSGVPIEIDKMDIFDYVTELLGDTGNLLRSIPTITREEFFDLLK